MLAEKLMNIMPIKSEFLKMLAGSIITALMISLGMVFILELMHFTISPAILAVFAVIGAAIYASRNNYKK